MRFELFLKENVDWVDGLIIVGDGGLLAVEEVEHLIGLLWSRFNMSGSGVR